MILSKTACLCPGFPPSLSDEIPAEAGGLIHPISGLMKPGEELAQVLNLQKKLGVNTN